MDTDLLIIGAGSAGMSAALGARQAGIEKIIIVERESLTGGVLPQCIHTGFGLTLFGEELTGPEFCSRLYELIKKQNISLLTDSAVIRISDNKNVLVTSAGHGVYEISARTVILATGCRERPIGSLPVSGTRPSGIFTAGAAQRLINLRGMDIGDDVVILGSGDIGMIMARRLKLLGKNVIALIEQASECRGLMRNRLHCLDDYKIPLLTSYTIVRVHGESRISGVTVCPVDSNFQPIYGRESFIACDTLLLSVGLIPERELISRYSENSSLPDWLFVTGNAEFVHDLVDDVSKEGELTGRLAAEFIKSGIRDRSAAKKELNYTAKTLKSNQMLCTSCPNGCILTIDAEDIKGAQCENGIKFARQEIVSPKRHLTATVSTKSGTRLPVRTSIPIDKIRIPYVMEELTKLNTPQKVNSGDVLIKNVLGTGSDIIASSDLL